MRQSCLHALLSACARQQTYRARTHAPTHTQMHPSVLRNTRRAIETDRLLAQTYASRVIVVAVDDEHWERHVQVGIVKVDCSRRVSQSHRLIVTGAMVARTSPCGSCVPHRIMRRNAHQCASRKREHQTVERCDRGASAFFLNSVPFVGSGAARSDNLDVDCTVT